MKLLLAIAAASLFVSPPAKGAKGAGEARPFPQHTQYAKGALKPSRDQKELDAALLACYREWKAVYLKAAPGDMLYVDSNAGGGDGKPRSPRSISEGHGYGMLALVVMAGADPQAHHDFDAMVRFLRAHPAKANPALMAWQQTEKDGVLAAHSEGDRETATDGDLDIALALLMADRQWGSGGAVDYRREAEATIRAIRAVEMDATRTTSTTSALPTLGSWVDAESAQRGGVRPSDLMPAHFKAFAVATGDPFWSRAADAGYKLETGFIAAHSPATGLMADFVVKKGDGYSPAPPHFLESRDDGAFSYNACRVPWRLGVDYLLTGDPRAIALLSSFNAWIERATGGDPAKLNAGYRLDGTPLKDDSSAAFTGPAAVAAMSDPARQRWLDALWADLLGRDVVGEGYYGGTLKLLTMMVLSGNWWQP